jgi:hypothetical protein
MVSFPLQFFLVVVSAKVATSLKTPVMKIRRCQIKAASAKDDLSSGLIS